MLGDANRTVAGRIDDRVEAIRNSPWFAVAVVAGIVLVFVLAGTVGGIFATIAVGAVVALRMWTTFVALDSDDDREPWIHRADAWMNRRSGLDDGPGVMTTEPVEPQPDQMDSWGARRRRKASEREAEAMRRRQARRPRP